MAKNEKEKDPVKQRAGRRGAQVRWQNMLRWFRRLVELRGGTFGPNWRVNLRGVVLTYVMLWRVVLPSSRKRRKRDREKDQEIKLALDKAIEAKQWGAVRRTAKRLEQRERKVQLPAAARLELEALIQRCDTSPFEMIEAMANHTDRERKFPWIHSNWRYETLQRALEVTADEIEKLEAIRRPGKKRMSRETSQLLRQAAVLRAIEQVERKHQDPSIRNVRRALNQKMSLETVRRYMKMNNLRKR
jgi:hypothetical protein